jgi:hypothetical protein
MRPRGGNPLGKAGRDGSAVRKMRPITKNVKDTSAHPQCSGLHAHTVSVLLSRISSYVSFLTIECHLLRSHTSSSYILDSV